MDIATKLTDLTNDLRSCRQAITEKGGEISANAGFAEVAEKILEIPSGTSIGTVIDDTASLIKQVPVNSVNHCFVKSIGGMTYKCNNLIPFPYAIGDAGFTQTKGNITITVNADRSFTLKGTAQGTPAFALASGLDLPDNVDYYLSGNLIGGEWASGVSIYTQNYSSATNDTPTVKCPKGKKFTWISVQVLNGTTVDATFKPMLSANEALPYEDYFEGLQDTKPTAIKVSGANLIPFPYHKDIGTTINGITSTVNADRSITLNGTATVTTSIYLAINIPLSADTYQLNVSGIEVTRVIPSLWHKETNVFLTNLKNANPTSPISTFTITEEQANQYYLRLHFYIYAGEVLDNVTIYPMLNRGSVALPYTDYKEPITYPIPEAVQGTGKGIEGASDTIDFEYGKAITNCTTVVFDGTEAGWEYRAEYHCILQNGNSLKVAGKGNGYIVSSLPINITYSNAYKNRFQIGGTSNPIENYGITSTDEWKSYLAELYTNGNPFTVTYAVEEPTEESLSVGFGLLPVEGGGSLEIITDNGKAIPNTIIYQTIV